MHVKANSSQSDVYQKGFTLIELLVALAISAVISALAYQSINTVVNVQTQVQSHSLRMESVQRAVWWMEQDFIQTAPREINDGYGSKLPAYQYRPDLGVEMTRIAEFPTPHTSGGLLRVGYRLEDNTLYRLTWSVIDRAPDSLPKKTAILTGVKRFELRVLGSDDQWVTSWPNETDSNPPAVGLPGMALPSVSLPKMTEVTIELEDMGVLKRLFMGLV